VYKNNIKKEMKHLKRFNEASFLTEDISELQYFCENYLAYLLDEGFGIRVRHGSREDRARIELYKDDIHFPAPFNWDDVKDHYIPFYQMLSKNYEISTMRNCTVKFEYRKPAKQLWETEPRWFTEEEIVNDKVEGGTPRGSYIGVISIFLDKN
jgi:hypothetical protein